MYFNQVTFNRKTLEDAAKIIASDTGAAIKDVVEYLNELIEKFQLLSSDGDSVTLKYPVPADQLRDFEEKLRRLAEEAMKSMDSIVYMNDILIEAPYRQPPYIERLHPRKDTYTTPYWHRTRSNPFRRNYH